MRHQKTILWSVSPFMGSKPYQAKSVAFVKNLSKSMGLPVQPAYVMSPSELRVGYELGSVEPRRMANFASDKLENFLDEAGADMLPARVVYENELSVSACAAKLASEAKRLGATMIVSSTRANHGVGLLGVGSFTQALLSASKVPVLTLNPTDRPISAPKRILFATDFGPSSRKSLRDTCRIAKAFGAEVVVFHAFFKPAPWIPDASGFYMGLPADWEKDYSSQVQSARLKKAEALAKVARRYGVKARVSVVETVASVHSALFRQAKREKADWIALASASGGFLRGVLGTTAQRVVHDAKVPVLVLKH